MRCISRYGRYMVLVRNQVAEDYATGGRRILQEQVMVQFEPFKVTQEERELALASFAMNGSMQEMDEATVVAPDYRIGSYDTRQAQLDRGWSDELREEVEARLRSLTDYHADFIVVPAQKFAPPWPRYNDYDGPTSALISKLNDEGHDLAEVLAYELSEDGLCREDVVAALNEAIEE